MVMTTGSGSLPPANVWGQNKIDATRPLGTVGNPPPSATPPGIVAAGVAAPPPAPVSVTPDQGMVRGAQTKDAGVPPQVAPPVPAPAPAIVRQGVRGPTGTQAPAPTTGMLRQPPVGPTGVPTADIAAGVAPVPAVAPVLKVGTDASSTGTMSFNMRDAGSSSLNTATPKAGQFAGMSDDQLFTLIAYGPDQNTKTAAMNAVWESLGGSTANYNSWLNSYSGPKQTELSGNQQIQAAMAAAGGGQPAAGAPPPGGWPTGTSGAPGAGGAPGAAGGAPGAGGVVNSGIGGFSGSGSNVVNGQDLGQFAPTGQEYNPVMGEVQANQTVQGQLGDILKTGNPLLEAAKARAMQAANSRGLQNSSMAVQSGEEAIVNTALPIAQADAAAYQKQALVNQDITNQFLSMKEGAQLDLQKAYEAFKQSNYLFDKDEKLKRYINDTGIASAEKISAMQNAAHIAAAQISASASVQAATIGATSQLQATGMRIDADKVIEQARLTSQDKINLAQLSQNAFTNYVSGMNTILTSQMEPADKDRHIADYNAMWSGNGYLKDAGITIKLPPVTTGTGGGG